MTPFDIEMRAPGTRRSWLSSITCRLAANCAANPRWPNHLAMDEIVSSFFTWYVIVTSTNAVDGGDAMGLVVLGAAGREGALVAGGMCEVFEVMVDPATWLTVQPFGSAWTPVLWFWTEDAGSVATKAVVPMSTAIPAQSRAVKSFSFIAEPPRCRGALNSDSTLPSWLFRTIWSRYEDRVHHQVVHVVTRRGVERSGAGDEAQLRNGSRSEYS